VLTPHLDLNVIEAMLLGPMVYSQIFQGERNAAHPELGPKVAEAFVRACATLDATHKKTEGAGAFRPLKSST
jgi:hypothetical protein